MIAKTRTARRRDPILPSGAFERWRRQAARWLRRSPELERQRGLFLRRLVVGRRVPIGWLLVVAAAGWMLYALVAGQQGILSLLSHKAERDRLATRIESLERRRAVLRERLRETSESPFLLEKEAREVYGMARPGEIVYQFCERELQPERSAETPGTPQGAELAATGVDSREGER